MNQLIKICDALDVHFLQIQYNDDEGDPCAPANEEKKTMTEIYRMKITGMTCTVCSTAITQQLEALDGVYRASVSLTLARATISYDNSVITPATLIRAVKEGGYDAALENMDALGTIERLNQTQELLSLRQAISSASIYSTLIAGLNYLPAFVTSFRAISCIPRSLAWIALLLALKVQVSDAWTIHMRAWKRGMQKMTMDTLLSLSLLLRLGLAMLQASLGQEQNSIEHASSGSFLVIIILAGRYLEAVLKRESHRNLATLYELLTEKEMYRLVDSEVCGSMSPFMDVSDSIAGDSSCVIAKER